MRGWQTVEIAGKRADVFFPARLAAEHFSLLFLHGHARITLRDNATYTSELARYGLPCVCPHGERAWWGDRVCAEFDPATTPAAYIRQSVLPWMKEKLGSEPPAIGLFGVSMGGQGALRLAFRHPQQFPVVAALSPLIDMQKWHGRGWPLDTIYETAEDARQDTATLLIHPLNWPRQQLLVCDPADCQAFEGTSQLASKLRSSGIPFEHDLTTRHGGHDWKYFNHMAPRVMQFLHESLLVEHRRFPTD
jgi:pimeloyl-ACP methyl ester carboxylesterase